MSSGLTVVALAAICFWAYFFGLGRYGIVDPGDGYFAEGAREMVELGDYVVPHLNYQVYFSKPVLMYWLVALSYHLFGVSEVSARLVSAVSATFLTAVVFYVGKALRRSSTGLIAACILASSPLVVTFARLSLVDMLFTAFLGGSLSAFLLSCVEAKRPWWAAMYVMLGLAVLTKGPAAVVLFLAAVAAYLVVLKLKGAAIATALERLRLPVGLLVVLAVASPWFVAVGAATGNEWPQVFFYFENVGRFLGATNHLHPNPAYYLATLAYGFFPWVLFLPAATVAAVRAGAASGDSVEGRTAAWLVCWTAVVMVFFGLSATKLRTYILPIFPALSLLVALHIDSPQFHRMRSSRAVSALLLAVGSVMVGAAMIALAWPHMKDCPCPTALAYLAQPLSTFQGLPGDVRLSWIGGLSLAGGGLVAQFARWRCGDARAAMITLMVSMVAGSGILAVAAFETADRFRDLPLRELTLPVRANDRPVAIFGEFKPSLMFYLRRPVDTFFRTDNLVAAPDSGAETGPAFYIICGRDRLPELRSAFPERLSLARENGRWCLLEARDLKLMRLPTLAATFSGGVHLNTSRYHWGTLPFAGGATYEAVRQRRQHGYKTGGGAGRYRAQR